MLHTQLSDGITNKQYLLPGGLLYASEKPPRRNFSQFFFGFYSYDKEGELEQVSLGWDYLFEQTRYGKQYELRLLKGQLLSDINTENYEQFSLFPCIGSMPLIYGRFRKDGKKFKRTLLLVPLP